MSKSKLADGSRPAVPKPPECISNVKDFRVYAAKRDQSSTPQAVAEGLINKIEAGNVKELIYLIRTEDGAIEADTTTLDIFEVIGLLEFTKLAYFSDGN